MDEVKKKSKTSKPTVPQDRVTLTPSVSRKMNAWLDQLNDKFKGLIDINKSDLTNYFIERQSDVLNRDQMEKIKAAHYDEVRFMHWALQKMKESKKNGEVLSLKDLVMWSETKIGSDVKRTRKCKGVESSAISNQIESDDTEKSNLEGSGKPNPA